MVVGTQSQVVRILLLYNYCFFSEYYRVRILKLNKVNDFMNYVGREAKARPKLFINFTITITKRLADLEGARSCKYV